MFYVILCLKVGFQALTAVCVKAAVFWDVAQYIAWQLIAELWEQAFHRMQRASGSNDWPMDWYGTFLFQASWVEYCIEWNRVSYI